MGAFFVFFGTLLLSQFVALLAALQLADYFQASEEFIAVMLALVVFVLVAMVVFATAYAMARSVSAIGWAAISLAVVAVAMVMVPSTIQRFAGRSTTTVGAESVAITLELLVPALIAILIQWGLVRRRFLRARGEDDLTLWPWVTFAIAGLAVLNPIGLSILGAALSQYPTDWIRLFWRNVALAAAAIVVVMIAIECYIRGRMLRRRRGANGATRG